MDSEGFVKSLMAMHKCVGNFDHPPVKVSVTTEEKELKEKAKTFERVIQYIVDDHIKVFGLHDDMLKPGITKIGFDDEFNVELTPIPYADLFIDTSYGGGGTVEEPKPFPFLEFFVRKDK
jgi:hypothetical protein